MQTQVYVILKTIRTVYIVSERTKKKNIKTTSKFGRDRDPYRQTVGCTLTSKILLNSTKRESTVSISKQYYVLFARGLLAQCIYTACYMLKWESKCEGERCWSVMQYMCCTANRLTAVRSILLWIGMRRELYRWNSEVHIFGFRSDNRRFLNFNVKYLITNRKIACN